MTSLFPCVCPVHSGEPHPDPSSVQTDIWRCDSERSRWVYQTSRGTEEQTGGGRVVQTSIWTTFTPLFKLTLVKLLLLWLNYSWTKEKNFTLVLTEKLPCNRPPLRPGPDWQLREPVKTQVTDLRSMFLSVWVKGNAGAGTVTQT